MTFNREPRSFRARSTKKVWDKEKKIARKVGVAWTSVTPVELLDIQLFLVITRDKIRKYSPMYLLTTIEITSKKLTWEMCHTYMHRWEIEQTF